MPEPIPDREKLKVKPAFEERYRSLLGDRYDEFMDYSLSFLRRSIRVNTLKSSVDAVKDRLSGNWKLEQIPWCPEGMWLESERRDVGNLVEHQLGYIYVQEAVSMIPPLVLEPKPGEVVLDMCASPGSKASQIGQYMQDQGVLVANDIKAARLRPLGLNLQRVGLRSAVITMMEGQRMRGLEFDRILVDAPCTGTGTIRKSLKTLLMWNPGMVRRLARIQKSLVSTAWGMLKPGGTLVYSTCTLEPEEDEGVVNHLLSEQLDAEIQPIGLQLKRSEPITGFEGVHYRPEVKKALRLWPQDNDTEGFFVAKFRKLPNPKI